MKKYPGPIIVLLFIVWFMASFAAYTRKVAVKETIYIPIVIVKHDTVNTHN